MWERKEPKRNIYGKAKYHPVVGITCGLTGMGISLAAAHTREGKLVYSLFILKGFCRFILCCSIVSVSRFERWLKAFFCVEFPFVLSFISVGCLPFPSQHLPDTNPLFWDERDSGNILGTTVFTSSLDNLLSEFVTHQLPMSFWPQMQESHGLQLTRLNWA